MQRLVASRRNADEKGFTLIELLVVIIILGVLAAVVVFAVSGVGDKGQSAAIVTDTQTVRTAQEAYCANRGEYGSEQDLVGKGLLSNQSVITDVATVPNGPCGTGAKSGFMLGYGRANNGSPASWDVMKLAAGTGNGYPTPFQSQRGPGNLNTNYLFDTLLWRDATGEPIPWLATAWEKSPNGLQWTFTLRTGVKWQDDTPATPRLLTANDVIFTFDYLKNATGVIAAQVTQVKNRNTFIRDFVTSVTQDPGDPQKVIFTLNSPVNTTMTRLAQSLLILPQHIWSTINNPITAAPANANTFKGTGPYVLQNPTTYNPGTGVSEYVANPNYFLGQPYVKRLQFVTVADELAALLTGQVTSGGVGNEESVPAAALAQVASFGRVENPGGWNRALHFNGLRGFPYDNATFRRAVAYTVDRQSLLQNIVGGRGELSSLGGLAPSHSYLNKSLPAYARDVNQATALLDSIGVVDGPDGDTTRELPATFGGNPVTGGGANFNVTLYTSDRFSTDTVEAVQAYLSDVGLASTYVVETSTAADSRAANADYNMAFVGYGNLTADPDQLRTRFKDVGTPSPTGTNFSAVWGWTTAGPTSTVSANAAEFSTLAAAQLIEPNDVVRRQQLDRMQELAATDVPLISLYVPSSVIFFPQGGFSAWYQTPGGTPPGPPGFSNKHVFITGKQFGLPPGF